MAGQMRRAIVGIKARVGGLRALTMNVCETCCRRHGVEVNSLATEAAPTRAFFSSLDLSVMHAAASQDFLVL